MSILIELFRQLMKKPATTKYPLVKEDPPSDLRGKPLIDDQKCIRCGFCERNCPGLAIKIGKPRTDEPTRIYLDKCVFCGLCKEICPVKAVKMTTIYELVALDPAELCEIQPQKHRIGPEKKEPEKSASN